MDISILDNPLFGVIITIFVYNIGLAIFKLGKQNPLLNPFLIGAGILMGIIKFFNIPIEYYNKGASIVSFFLGPTTVALSYLLYKQLRKLKEYFVPIMVGAITGAITAIISVILIGKALGLEEILLKSFVPKSITTPLGIELSNLIGGIPAITIFSIAITGVSGNIMATTICKLFKINHPVARGIGIGVASHAVGTAKAIEIGEVEGAMSALSIVVAGVVTFVITPFLVRLI